MPFRHDILVLVPVVEHVAQEPDGQRFVLDAVEPTHQLPLDGQRVAVETGAEVGVGGEKDLLAFVLHAAYLILYIDALRGSPAPAWPRQTSCPYPIPARTPG